jgi:O-methyltransferase involved in polyketide biosynthesis
MRAFEGHPALLALLVNESRSRRPNVSEDPYSRDWIPPHQRFRVAKLWNDYAKLVYPFDDIVLGVRNRFFLEQIRRTDPDDCTVMIVPCGLTSYPYLANERRDYIEADLEPLIEFKRRQSQQLIKGGVLPSQQVEYLVCDLAETGAIQKLVARSKPTQPRILVIEGLSYYLTRPDWDLLVQDLRDSLRRGDVLAFDYWDSQDANKQVYGRFLQFCKKHAGFNLERFNFLDARSIRSSLQGFRCEFSDVISEERRYSAVPELGRRTALLRDRYVVATKS